MQVRMVENAADFATLEGPWQDLARESQAHPFQEFGWAAAWVRTLGTLEGRQLRVFTVWEGDKLRAVLPLISRRFKGVRLLEWVGARATDYCDALFDPAVDAGTLTGELRGALRDRGAFDVLRLGQVSADAHVNALAEDMRPWVETLQQAYQVPLTWDSGSAWLQAQSKNLRSNVRKREKKLNEAGFEFRVLRPDEPHEDILNALLEQKRTWLAARGMPSMLTEPQGEEFLRAVCAEMARSGTLCVSAIQSQDKKVAACNVSFFRHGHFYSYLSSYDPAMSESGAGSLLRQLLLMWVCDHGGRVFDLLTGGEAYKKDFATTSTAVRTLVVARGLLGRAARSYYRYSSAKAQATAVDPPAA